MTDPDLSTGHPHECGDDVAAYALGALEPAEVEAFERHLQSCAVCRDELAAFEQTVDFLPLSAPAHRASPALRQRVMRAVAQEGGRAARPARARRGPTWLAIPRPALALGAALLLAVLVFAGVRLSSSSTPGTRVIAAQVTGEGTAQLRLSGDRGELIVHHFAAPPAGEIYEVWLQRRTGAPSPTDALFSVTASGDADVAVPGDLHGVRLVMVTPEPAGGTSRPTHPAVLSASLT